MKIILIILLLFISNCKLNKVVKHHGVNYLDKKQKTLQINTTNQNDIMDLLGPPSTRSKFDNDLWIYIERKTSKHSVFKLGKKKTIVNNVLVLEIDDNGLLVKKNFLNINDMKEIKFSENETERNYSKNSFVYDFLTSLRHKMNDPLGKRKK
tara:strand:+ start:227 stop:682 length:456 start_codon:yes stop_codon:yes gene_type:complete